MKKLRNNLFLFLLSSCCWFLPAQTFQESGGLVVMEIESAPVVDGWAKESSVSGYTGTGYYRATKDSLKSGGKGLLEYPIQITNAGEYQLQWRSRILQGSDSTEHNDNWARLVDSSGNPVTPVANGLDPKGSWYKIYMNTTNKWHWQASNKDRDPKAVAWNLSAGQQYTLQVSYRSKGHGIDRILLWNRGGGFGHNFGNNKGQPKNESQADALPESESGNGGGNNGGGNNGGGNNGGGNNGGGGGSSFSLDARDDFPDITAGTVPYYKDSSRDALAIDASVEANRQGYARAVANTSSVAGTYDVTLTTVTEEDGESIYRLLVNGSQVATFTNPYIGPGSAQDLQPHTHVWQDIEIPENATISLESNADTNGEIPEDGGTAWARGRWQQLDFVPDDGNGGGNNGGGNNGGGTGNVSITGELKQYHKITLDLEGPNASEGGSPNPFTDYRMTVTFSNGSTTLEVPGYFAADGNAAESSATSGNVWRAHLNALNTGTWTYEIDFRSGSNSALGGGSELAPYDGTTGSFDISASDKSGVDFRRPERGRLDYVGEHALRWQGDDSYFFKVGMNHPEVFLEYEDFDNTDSTRSYSTHSGDWNNGDPDWKSGKGRELIGVVNYLSEQGMNVQYFLTMNVNGDGKKAYPWTGSLSFDEFDVSKLDQWGIVFDHMMAKGVMTHFVLDERENQSLFENRDNDSTSFADARKIYYREMIARFGYLNAITWNVGEESGWQKDTGDGASISSSQQIARASYVKDLSPYEDHIVIHNGPSDDDSIFNSLVGSDAFTGPAYQGDLSNLNHGNGRIAYWRKESANKGHKWVVTYDEPYTSGKPARNTWRKNALWASISAGAAGAEIYSSGDTSRQNWRDFSSHYPDLKRAKEFMLSNTIPFWNMQPDNDLTSRGYCLAIPGVVYLLYLPSGGTPELDLSGQSGTFSVQWFDPRNDGNLQNGSITSVSGGGGSTSLGSAPSNSNDDWVVLVRSNNNGGNIAPTVDAGSDRTLLLGNDLNLNPSVFDPDGDPLSYQWVKVSGPGTVSFGDDEASSTTASFSNLGEYVLSLTVDDGEDSVEDSLTVTVLEANTDHFQEENGLVVFEVESSPALSGWRSETTISDYKGDAYYYCTQNGLSSGGNGLLEYNFDVTNAGEYQLQWRSYIAKGSDSTEHNDSWARLVDSDGNPVTPIANSLDPTGSWYKVYMNTTGRWHWQASNVDGNPKAIAWNLEAGKTYTFQISARSEGHAIDRVLLWNRSGGFGHNFGNNKGQPSNADAATALPESSRGIAGNRAPTVNAGSDLTVIIGNSATLDGSVTDPDGDPMTHQWSKQSGPGTVSFGDSTAVDTTAGFSETGTYVLQLRSEDDSSLSSTDTVTVNVIPEPGPVVLAINCGGPDLVTSAGVSYEADRGFSAGKSSSTNNAIAGTEDDELFQTSRWHNPLGYALSVPNGEYSLVLHLSENYWSADGKRVFDIEVEGVLVEDDLDIHARAGGKHIALEIVVPVNIQDGELNLNFPASTDNATLTGFRLESAETPAEGFSVWADEVYGAGASSDKDPDFVPFPENKMSNFVYYALGIDTPAASSSYPVGYDVLMTGGARLKIEFPRHSDRADVIYEVEVSEDLVTWNVIARSMDGDPVVDVDNRSHEVSESGASDMKNVVVEDKPLPVEEELRFIRLNLRRR